MVYGLDFAEDQINVASELTEISMFENRTSL